MIILRSKFYSSEEEEDVKKNNKDLAKALGIAGGSAALGAGVGYGFNKIGKKLLNKKGESLSAEARRRLNEEGLAAAKYQWGHAKANADTSLKKVEAQIKDFESMLAKESNESYKRNYKNYIEKQLKPQYEELEKISRSEELLKQAKKEEASLLEKYKISRDLHNKAKEKEEKFLRDLPGKLKRNKKLAWGVGLGTAALGSLGAYEYYKSKKKNK